MLGSNLKYVISIVILSILLVASLGFGGWAYTSRADYKDNSDKKAAEAVEAAKVVQKQELDAQYAEQAKQPFRSYKGSLTYGGVEFNYPRTWSALIEETAEQPINAYFHPDVLPPLDAEVALALRVELLATEYSTVAAQYQSDVENGTLKATAYVPPKLVGVANVQPGLKLDGEIAPEFQGSMVVIKVRDKTLQITTQSKDFLKDFNETVLASLTFVP